MKYCTALQITLLYIIHQYAHLNQQGAHFWYTKLTSQISKTILLSHSIVNKRAVFS